MTEHNNFATRILYTMLRVGDLDRSIAFDTDALGMTEIRRKRSHRISERSRRIQYRADRSGQIARQNKQPKA
ncbi:VOC family protein [Pseudosulfitobacter sp. SM2401]|uniref:VOC family protein n=1 Tax=Pseudosulfitobacter sp. SM2401 TaxID=3350098 RepID=UPI0036F35DA9